MNKVLGIIIGILIVGSVGWLAIYNRHTSDKLSSQARSGRAPDLTLQDYAGKTVRLGDFTDKPLVINSWAARCPFCRKELVDFATVQKEFGDKVIIIAVDRAEPRDTAKKYTDELGVTDDIMFLIDPADSFYQSISGFSMPETVFVDSGGSIVFHKRGPMDIQEIREKIQQLISR